jgi:hypothetical protein
MTYKFFIKCFLIFPLILLLLNIYNNFFPTDYRNDPNLINAYLSKENKKLFNYISQKNRKEILKYEDAIKQIDQLYFVHGQTLKFLDKATKVYVISIAPESWKEQYTKIKFKENWILYFVRKYEEIQINKGQKSKYNGSYIFYQSSDYKFALKRGISICSQDALSFANLIKRRYNMDYNIVGLGGHVVMQAKINNKYYLSDPHTGLTFDFSIDEYYNDDENRLKIKNAYTGIGRSNLVDTFDREGNRKFNYTGPKLKDNTYYPDNLTFFSNYIKWLLPIFFLLIGFYLNYKERKI